VLKQMEHVHKDMCGYSTLNGAPHWNDVSVRADFAHCAPAQRGLTGAQTGRTLPLSELHRRKPIQAGPQMASVRQVSGNPIIRRECPGT
jgi:hypothetical protein